MDLPTTENRLTKQEIAFRRQGNSPEIADWNQQFGLLIGEYLEAMDCGDEGWIGSLVHEVRKCMSELKRTECHLAIIAKHVQHCK